MGVDEVRRFIADIREVDLVNCFNPYRDTCNVFDKDDAVAIRIKNLTKVLVAANKRSVVDLWIGRDLGYRGGRRTGLALTDERSLEVYSKKLGIECLQRSTFGEACKEQTATTIHEFMSKIDSTVILWNVFPFHPHEHEMPFTNRAHSAREAHIGLEVLKKLMELVGVRRLIAIGNDAAQCRGLVSADFYTVRHPSYGGKPTFVRQMQDIYNLDGQSLYAREQGNSQLNLL